MEWTCSGYADGRRALDRFSATIRQSFVHRSSINHLFFDSKAAADCN